MVPNCQDIDLVMWVFCLNNTFWSRTSTEENEVTFDAEMLRFVIARGLNLNEHAHGILGMFKLLISITIMVLFICDLRSKVLPWNRVHIICLYTCRRTKLSTVTLLFLTYRPVLEYPHASGALYWPCST